MQKSSRLSIFTLIGLIFGLFIIGGGNAKAQDAKNITGTVTDSHGEAIISGSVKLKNTTTATITDIDGKYKISVPSDGVLVFSYLGYTTLEVPVSQAKGGVLDVVLQEQSNMLDELVVVGYGVMRKSDLTGSVATTKGSDIIKQQSFSALEGLKGKSAGVNIFNNTGQPGGEIRVMIRGISTINASTSPLYIVDGVAMSDFNLLNPNDIESIEVLKDASAAAIYGARGANGVVMVTTKRGNAGEGVKVSYDGSISISSMARKMDVMNSAEWMAAFKQGLDNANAWQGTNFDTDLSKIFTDPRFFDSNGKPLYDTDWQDEASRTSVSHNHQLNIQRSGKDYSMGAFLNYTDQQGVLLNTYMKRVNAKLTYDDKPTDWLSTSVNVLVNHTWGQKTSDNPYHQGALRTMIEQLPFLPVKYDGVYTQNNIVQTSPILIDRNDPNRGTQGFSPENVGNPVEQLKNIKNMQYRTQVFGNAALTFHLMKGLDLKTQLGIDFHNNRNAGYTPFQPRPILDHSSNGSASASNSHSLYWQEETYLTYITDINKHHINAMAGASWQAREYTYSSSSQSGFTDDFYGYYNLGNGTDRPGVDSDYDKWAMNSYFLRLAYNYNNTYMATVTGRYDGSSKFGQNNKYAFFPSIGLGWLASNEQFLVENKTISKLKLHTSFGITGNSEIGTYRSLATISQSSTIIGGEQVNTSYVGRMPNPNLKWEKTAQWDFGFELGLFHDRLNFDISYYYKYTSDLLLDRPIPHSTGFTSIMDNIGEVSNRGLDILITAYPIQTKDFTWSSTLNLGFNKNRVEKLDKSSSIDPISGKRQITLDGFVSYDMLIREGEPLSTFYGYKRIGIYDGHPENWDANTMNIPSTIGEKVTSKNKQIIGNGLPDWTGSFINTFNYKGFDLTLDFQFSLGADIMQEYYHSTVGRFYTNGLSRLFEEAWHPDTNPNGKEQALRLANFGQGNNANADSDWVCDGSYLRLNMIQLGYTFDKNLVKKIGLSALRVYASASNVFLLCSDDYEGYDPDNSTRLGDNNWGTNRQFFSYPRARSFTLGLNVAF